MIDKFLDQIPERWVNFFIKVILVACVTMCIKIALQMKKEKVSLVNLILSVVVGIGFAVLTGPLILDNFSPNWATVLIAAVTLVSEKIGNFFLYKFNVDGMLQDFIDYLSRKVKK